MNQHLQVLRENARDGRGFRYQDNSPAAITAYANQFTREAIEFFVQVLRDPNAEYKERRAAARELLDRGIGKPRQTIQVDGSLEMNVTTVKSGMKGLREAVIAEEERLRDFIDLEVNPPEPPKAV